MPAAAAAADADAGGMFAGLHVGTTNQSAAAAAPAPSASSLLSGLEIAPQSPIDALAGLQGPPPTLSTRGMCMLTRLPVPCSVVLCHALL